MKATIIKKGGKGSGNYGHEGRPGKVGGSQAEGNSGSGVSMQVLYSTFAKKFGFDTTELESTAVGDNQHTFEGVWLNRKQFRTLKGWKSGSIDGHEFIVDYLEPYDFDDVDGKVQTDIAIVFNGELVSW